MGGQLIIFVLFLTILNKYPTSTSTSTIGKIFRFRKDEHVWAISWQKPFQPSGGLLGHEPVPLFSSFALPPPPPCPSQHKLLPLGLIYCQWATVANKGGKNGKYGLWDDRIVRQLSNTLKNRFWWKFYARHTSLRVASCALTCRYTTSGMLVIVDSDFDNFYLLLNWSLFRYDFHHSLTPKSKTRLFIQTMIGLIAYPKHDCSANVQMLLLY